MSYRSIPPAIRCAPWVPPHIGTYYLRASDRSVWQVSDVFRRDQQVKLTPDNQALRVRRAGLTDLTHRRGDEPIYVFAAELLRDFRQVAS